VERVPSRNHIASCLDKLYVERILKVKSLISDPLRVDYFSISVDGWKLESKGTPMYCMVVHFLTEDFQLLALPLEVSATLDKTAAGIKAWVRAVFLKFGLSFDKLLCLTSDEASAETAATTLLGCARVSCVPHRLSNVIKNAFIKAELETKVEKPVGPDAEVLVRATKKMVKFINNRKDIRAFHDAERVKHGKSLENLFVILLRVCSNHKEAAIVLRHTLYWLIADGEDFFGKQGCNTRTHHKMCT
jgi:hypothetical protein